MKIFKEIAEKLGKALSFDEMKQIKGGYGLSCGVCNGEYVRPGCGSTDPIWPVNCTCHIPGMSCG